jgi:hypothetical protein
VPRQAGSLEWAIMFNPMFRGGAFFSPEVKRDGS